MKCVTYIHILHTVAPKPLFSSDIYDNSVCQRLMQTAAGSASFKQLLSDFRGFRKEVTASFGKLSAENAELKSHLREMLNLLRLFTTGHSHSRGTDHVGTPEDAFENPVGDDDAGDEVLVEEEFSDMHAYSQSKCVTPSPVTRVVTEPALKVEAKDITHGTASVEEEVPANVSEKKNEESGNSGGDVEGQQDVIVSAASADEDINEEYESWLAHMDDDSEPVELTKSEYLKLHPTRRPPKPNPKVAGGPWTPYGKGTKLNTVLSDLKSPINEAHLTQFMSWYEHGLVRTST